MTDVSKGIRTLRLQGSPERSRLWLLIALAFGVPVIVMTGILTVALMHNAPLAPILFTAALVIVASGLATVWIERMIRRISVALDGDSLIIDTGIVARRFPFSTLRAAGMRTVSLAEHIELKPTLRTWGIGAPGLSCGWFRLRNGGKALCILTESERVTVLRADDGIWILLSLADPSTLRAVLGA
jgi:hypothetical protein